MHIQMWIHIYNVTYVTYMLHTEINQLKVYEAHICWYAHDNTSAAVFYCVYNILKGKNFAFYQIISLFT